MFTPVVGIIVLVVVFMIAISDRGGGELGFLDPHAAIVVFGGVVGALCLSIEKNSLVMMLKSMRDILPFVGRNKHDVANIRDEVKELRDAWRGGQRSKVLEMADTSKSIEIRAAAQALFKRSQGAGLSEVFSELRTKYINQYQPVIEGWDLVGRLAPSFGMVGTVTGMVQLFRNMGADSGSLGGAMGMALLATLYGITFGAAVGSPMATRVLNRMNEYLATMDLLEQTVAALNETAAERT